MAQAGSIVLQKMHQQGVKVIGRFQIHEVANALHDMQPAAPDALAHVAHDLGRGIRIALSSHQQGGHADVRQIAAPIKRHQRLQRTPIGARADPRHAMRSEEHV